ncbi:RNA polymerase III, subunit Rpc25, partial [Russula aff. rugulosa BPL654]
RLVVFRPFPTEIILAKVKSSDEDGIQCDHTAQFSCTIYSDPNERAYFWLPSSEATSTHQLLDSPEEERLYIDQGEIVRVRVERDEFCDDEPGPPKATERVRRSPYTVTCSIAEQGLGPIAWWK